MIRLVRVELNRYGSRRAIALLILLAALLAGLAAAQAAWDSRPMSVSERATATAQADIQANRSDIKADLDKCLADPEQYLGAGATTQECRDTLIPAPTSFLPRDPLDLEGTLDGNGLGVAVLIVGLLIIAAATFAGADWASGSMATQLLFEPRRRRLWAAKAIAVTLASGVVALVVLAGFWGAMYAVADARGLLPTHTVTQDIGWHVLRAIVLAMAAALGAYALTMAFRHTVGTLGLLFAYSIGGELLVTLLPIDGVARWSLGNNVLGWLTKSLHYFDPTTSCGRFGDCTSLTTLHHLPAGLYLLVLLILAMMVSLVSFARRDV